MVLLNGTALAEEATAQQTLADSLGAAVDSLRMQAKYGEAVVLARQRLAVLKSETAVKPYQLADGERLIRDLQFAAALPESSKRELAEADRLTEEIESAFARGNHADGESYARRQLEIRRRLLGAEHPAVSASLNDLAVLLADRADYAGAEPLYRESLAMRRKLLGDDHPTVAESLNNLAMLLRDRGDLASAEPLQRESLAVDRRLLGGEHPDVAMDVNNLALLLQDRGDYAGAEPLFRESLAMRCRLLGERHPQVAASLNNLASCLQDRGDYAGAEPLFRESLAMRRRFWGEEHPDVARSLNNLAVLLAERGDPAGAEPLQRESLAMFRKLLGEENPDVALSLNNLAMLLRDHGDYAGAEPLFRESLAMYRKLLGEENPHVALTLSYLATLLQDRGDYAGAEPLFRGALAMRRRLLGEEHPKVAESLNNLALLLQARGDYAGAEPLFRESVGRLRKLLGEEHPYVATSLSNLGMTLRDRGNHADAERVLVEAASSFEAARLRAGSGLERVTFLKASPYPALAATHLVLNKDAEAWPAVERSQGRALADLLLIAESRGLSPAEAEQEKTLRLALGDQERQLEAFRRAVRADSSIEADRRVEEAPMRLLEAEARWSAFERELAVRHPVTEGQSFELARVQAALGADEGIVGWLDLRDDQKAREPQSWGYMIRNQGPVQWQRLTLEPPAENLNERVKRWFAQLKARRGENPQRRHRVSVAETFRLEVFRRPLAPQSETQNASVLWHERFAPLMTHLEGARHLIVVPSGEMLGIPVEALMIAGSGEAMGDRFAISYAPSATIYTWLVEKRSEDLRLHPGSAPRRGDGPCLAVADPPFTAEDLAAMPPRSDAPVTSSLASASLFRSLEIPEDSLESKEEGLLRSSALAGNREALTKLTRLPATRAEASAIVARSASGSRLLVGPEASEQALVRMTESGELSRYRTIHLATHALVDDERPERSALVLSQVDLPDPYEAAVNGERIYDGLLDAKEIVREWKLDADLVTLSACETGLGKKVAGEGYVGLAHAFLQAGARSLLVSLWRVEDRSTSMLMERFYENWRGGYIGIRGDGHALGASLPKVEALQEAKRWLREWRDQAGRQPYAHPYYWAGFILIGESA
jgi:CHAT domain-containing protein/Tfp pilus assembly protein PilF